jgi:hypothetical protein
VVGLEQLCTFPITIIIIIIMMLTMMMMIRIVIRALAFVS